MPTRWQNSTDWVVRLAELLAELLRVVVVPVGLEPDRGGQRTAVIADPDLDPPERDEHGLVGRSKPHCLAVGVERPGWTTVLLGRLALAEHLGDLAGPATPCPRSQAVGGFELEIPRREEPCPTGWTTRPRRAGRSPGQPHRLSEAMLLVIIVLSALAVSALCSILEATLLSVSVVSLSERRDQGDQGADRLLDLKQVHLESSIGAILTPRTVMVAFQQDLTVSDALAVSDARSFSRIPLYGVDRDDMQGYVLMRDLLHKAVDNGDLGRPVSGFLRPMQVLDDTTTVGDALSTFMSASEHVALVTDPLGVVSGLVTMEDLIETALGVEIVDEKDEVADLRQLAIQLRNQRLERMQIRRDTAAMPDTSAEDDA